MTRGKHDVLEKDTSEYMNRGLRNFRKPYIHFVFMEQRKTDYGPPQDLISNRMSSCFNASIITKNSVNINQLLRNFWLRCLII